MRERKKKTYKDDFDYNLSDEEEGGNKASAPAGSEPVKPESAALEPGGMLSATEEIPIQEENLTVEKILALRTITKVFVNSLYPVWPTSTMIPHSALINFIT